MKKLLNAIPLLAAVALLFIAFKHGFSNSNEIAADFPIWQVKEGSVYDGDTLRLKKSGQEIKVRFACLDSPEVRPKQEGGIEARDHLRSLLNQAGNQVKVNATDTDRYGRTVAELWMDRGNGWELVQLQQVKDGWAWANGKYKEDCPSWNAIASAEKKAKAARRGIWAGNPEPPWEFRQRNRENK
jgi:endonuclease YncB( thermonuclease family)